MFAEERKLDIQKQLKVKGKVTVNELAEAYDVSKATIRRDLRDLEAMGLVQRTHGGAVEAEHTKYEPTYFEKEDKYSEEKAVIGKYAAKFIKDGDTIALDSGTTTLQVAQHIEAKDIVVVTNSIVIAEELTKKEGIEVILTGGNLRPETLALVGPVAEMNLDHYNIDKVFLGANGIDMDKGFTTPNVIEASIKRKFIERSSKIVFVCDSSKIGHISFANIATINKVDVLITEAMDQKDKRAYEQEGLTVFITGKE